MNLDYLARAAVIALAWLAVVNLAATAAVAIAAPRIARSGRARGSAVTWLTLRLLPASASVIFVALLFLPSYFRFEPRDPGEGVDVTLAALALAAAAIVLTGVARGIRSWRRASRKSRAWIRRARSSAAAVILARRPHRSHGGAGERGS